MRAWPNARKIYAWRARPLSCTLTALVGPPFDPEKVGAGGNDDAGVLFANQQRVPLPTRWAVAAVTFCLACNASPSAKGGAFERAQVPAADAQAQVVDHLLQQLIEAGVLEVLPDTGAERSSDDDHDEL